MRARSSSNSAWQARSREKREISCGYRSLSKSRGTPIFQPIFVDWIQQKSGWFLGRRSIGSFRSVSAFNRIKSLSKPRESWWQAFTLRTIALLIFYDYFYDSGWSSFVYKLRLCPSLFTNVNLNYVVRFIYLYRAQNQRKWLIMNVIFNSHLNIVKFCI